MSLAMPAPSPSDREMLLNAEIEALPGLTRTEKAMLRLIIRLDDAGFTTNRLEYLGGQVGVRKRQAKNIMRALAAKGHVVVTRRPGLPSIIRPSQRWITLWTNEHLAAARNQQVGQSIAPPVGTSGKIIAPPVGQSRPPIPPINSNKGGKTRRSFQQAAAPRRWLRVDNFRPAYAGDRRSPAIRLRVLLAQQRRQGRIVLVKVGGKMRRLMACDIGEDGAVTFQLAGETLFEPVEQVHIRMEWMRNFPVYVQNPSWRASTPKPPVSSTEPIDGRRQTPPESRQTALGRDDAPADDSNPIGNPITPQSGLQPQKERHENQT